MDDLCLALLLQSYNTADESMFRNTPYALAIRCHTSLPGQRLFKEWLLSMYVLDGRALNWCLTPRDVFLHYAGGFSRVINSR